MAVRSCLVLLCVIGLLSSTVEAKPRKNQGGGQGQPGQGQGQSGQGQGQPGQGQGGQGQPEQGEGPPGQGQPGQGRPGQGQPGQGPPGQERPGQGQPGQGQPGQGRPGQGQSGQGQSGEGKRPPHAPEQMICGRNTPDELVADLNEAYENATQWVLSQRTMDWGWPLRNTASAIAFLQLADNSWYGRGHDLTAQLSVKQLQIELLAHLLQIHTMSRPDDQNSTNSNSSDMGLITRDGEMMPGATGMLPYYIMALKSTCQDPTDFFGVDFVELLQRHMDQFPMGDFNNHFEFGLGILALCVCDVDIKPEYIEEIIQGGQPLNNAFMVGPDMASMILMAMSCIKDKVPSEYEMIYSQVMKRTANYLWGSQNGGGRIGRSAVSTAFAAQALMAAETSPTKWKCAAAVRSVLDAQDSEGGFESLGGTLRILPMLVNKSLANLKDMMPKCGRPEDSDRMPAPIE
ncbi:uncharacterized protein CG3556-like isoform X2 [Amphiura filiformis]|uniref:uncharacterized protein CG3556-like isoform X2 n=1 Tax=Amphiura filiformis TaxID=82378 RepID=UPI003B216786